LRVRILHRHAELRRDTGQGGGHPDRRDTAHVGAGGYLLDLCPALTALPDDPDGRYAFELKGGFCLPSGHSANLRHPSSAGRLMQAGAAVRCLVIGKALAMSGTKPISPGLSPLRFPAAGDAGVVFTPLNDCMTIAADGLNLNTRPTEALAARLRHALLDHQVLCIRDQDIGPGGFLAAMSVFGEPQIRPEIPHVPGFPAVTTLSSEDRDAKGDCKRLVAGANGHSDDTFMARPSALTAVYGIIVPLIGGDTQYANMYAAYEALPAAVRQRLDALKVVHTMKPDRPGIGRTRTIASELLAQRRPSVHPLVRTHIRRPDARRCI